MLGVETIRYRDGRLWFLDQTRLPDKEAYVEIQSAEDAWDAIRRLVVRGAPAIGVGAACALAVASQGIAEDGAEAFLHRLQEMGAYLCSARPTAINLSWAVERMVACARSRKNVPDIRAALVEEALCILREDADMCRRIGEHGQAVIREGMGILTHCNAGALATAGYGTALAPIYVAKERGISVQVFCDETRPLLQGSRLTAFELWRAGVDTTLITDSMAATVMKNGWVDLVLVGADHVAANGDSANKIGTYGVALLAAAHNIPFYVACPSSTICPGTATGSGIEIEQRDRDEVIRGMGKLTAPEGVQVYNPAFDVTPASLITGIITERGILRPPFGDAIAGNFAR